jgi:hypothetical protein
LKLRDRVVVIDVAEEQGFGCPQCLTDSRGDRCGRGIRLGGHHPREPADSYRSDELMFLTYSIGSLRVYDLVEPSSAVEITSHVPECHFARPAIRISDVWGSADHVVSNAHPVGGGRSIRSPHAVPRARTAGAAA